MSDIVGKDAAKAALAALLPAIEAKLQLARTASGPDQIKAREAAKKQLSDFFNSTRPQNFADPADVSGVQAVDQIAFDLFSELTAEQVDLGVGLLRSGAERLAALSTSLDEQTATLSGAARSISLQPLKKVVDQMTAMVNSVKALKTNLKADKPDEAAVAKQIDDLVTQFEALRTAVSAAA